MHLDVRHGVFGQVFADVGDNPSFDVVMEGAPQIGKRARRSDNDERRHVLVRTTSSKAATDLRVHAILACWRKSAADPDEPAGQRTPAASSIPGSANHRDLCR